MGSSASQSRPCRSAAATWATSSSACSSLGPGSERATSPDRSPHWPESPKQRRDWPRGSTTPRSRLAVQSASRSSRPWPSPKPMEPSRSWPSRTATSRSIRASRRDRTAQKGAQAPSRFRPQPVPPPVGSARAGRRACRLACVYAGMYASREPEAGSAESAELMVYMCRTLRPSTLHSSGRSFSRRLRGHSSAGRRFSGG